MTSDTNRMDHISRAQELKLRGESARRRDSAMARLCYEEAVTLFRGVDQPLVLAHTIRHLGDVYQEQGRPDLAEPCYPRSNQALSGSWRRGVIRLGERPSKSCCFQMGTDEGSLGRGATPLHQSEYRGRNQGERISADGSFGTLDCKIGGDSKLASALPRFPLFCAFRHDFLDCLHIAWKFLA